MRGVIVGWRNYDLYCLMERRAIYLPLKRFEMQGYIGGLTINGH